MKSLASRIFLVLLLATGTIQFLSFAGVIGAVGSRSQRAMIDFMAADVAFVHRFLQGQPPGEREPWLPRLNRGYYELLLQPLDQPNPPASREPLLGTAASIAARLGPQATARPVRLAGSGTPAVEMPLDDRQKLLVAFADEPPFSPPPVGVVLAYLGIVFVAVMPFAWLAVRLATRPLTRLAAAAEALGANLRAPQVPELGTQEVVRAARAFNAMQRAIQRHLDERTEILAAVSHDLKTPLTRLGLRLGEMSPPELRARCEADIAAMQALVQEGLDYAASSQLREARVPLDVNRLVEDLADNARDLGARVEVLGHLDAPLPCSPRALERALQNLVDNAVRHGGGTVRITLAATRAGVELTVEDEGPGLPDEQLRRAFEPFFRAEGSRNRATGGTGLGLAIARNLVRAQGGEIVLANRPQGGLCARLSLPAQAGPGAGPSPVAAA